MYKIELIRGAGWGATVMETHPARDTIHIVDIERMALALLDKAQREPNAQRPNGYRIINATGKLVKASNT
jgi:hypothetical protein